jgi:hypothetical protein
MAKYLKQSEVDGAKKKCETKKESPKRPITTYERVCEMDRREPTDLGGIEHALERLADQVGQYVRNSNSDGHNTLAVFTGPEGSGYYPVLVALEPTSESTERLMDSLERIAGAFERIADFLSARPMGEPGSASTIVPKEP